MIATNDGTVVARTCYPLCSYSRHDRPTVLEASPRKENVRRALKRDDLARELFLDPVRHRCRPLLPLVPALHVRKISRPDHGLYPFRRCHPQHGTQCVMYVTSFPVNIGHDVYPGVVDWPGLRLLILAVSVCHGLVVTTVLERVLVFGASEAQCPHTSAEVVTCGRHDAVWCIAHESGKLCVNLLARWVANRSAEE